MHVLMVSTFPPRRCGIGDYTADLASEIAKSKNVSVSVLTYSDGQPGVLAEEDGIAVSRSLDNKPVPRRLVATIRALAPDVIHFQSATFLHNSSVNSAVGATTHCPLVTTVHDAPRSWRVAYTIRNLRTVYRRSARIFAHSEEVAKALVQFHRVDPSRILRIRLGVNTTLFNPGVSDLQARRRYGLQDSRVVLYFGFLRPGKGIDVLLRAWQLIEKQHPDTTLVLAGGTPTRAMRYAFLLRSEATYPKMLHRLSTRLGIENRVVFTDFVESGTVPSLLASADIVVLPYDHGSPQSGPMHKALSSGKPLIASDTVGFREVLQPDKEAVLVPPGDPRALANAISYLLDNAGIAREIGQNARRRAETELNWSIIAKRSLEVYRSLLEGSEWPK